MQTKTQKLKHWRVADLVSQSGQVGYEFCLYPVIFAVSAAFKKIAGCHRLCEMPALSPTGLPWFLFFALLYEGRAQGFVFVVDEVKFLKRLFWD